MPTASRAAATQPRYRRCMLAAALWTERARTAFADAPTLRLTPIRGLDNFIRLTYAHISAGVGARAPVGIAVDLTSVDSTEALSWFVEAAQRRRPGNHRGARRNGPRLSPARRHRPSYQPVRSPTEDDR